MEKRIPLNCTKIELEGTNYTIDRDFGIRYGGSSLIYQVWNDYGEAYILKECYPSKLQDWITRDSNGTLNVLDDSLSLNDVKDLFEKFKELSKQEEEILKTLKDSYVTTSRYKYKSNNPEVHSCSGCFHKNNTIYLLLKTNASESLSDKISEWDKKTFFSKKDLKDIIEIITGILDRTYSLNNKYKLLHLDICPDNILIASGINTVHLIDFNSAFHLESDTGYKYNRAYSSREGYSSVELKAYSQNYLNYGELTEKSDSYSIGAILFRIFAKRIIKNHDKMSPLKLTCIVKERLKNFEEEVQQKIIEIITKSTSNNPEKRYDIISFKKQLAELKDIIVSAPLKTAIANLTDKIARTRERLRITQKKLRVCASFLGVLILVVSLYSVCLPNIKDHQAYKDLERGNAKDAYEQLLEIYDIFSSKPRLLHPFYSEEKLKTLAWHIYQQRTLETTVEFEENVIQAVKTHDNNQIIALLENSEIVAKNLSVNITPANSFSVPNKEGLLSSNGMYYATINNNAVLEVYHIGNKKLYEFENVENFALDNNYLLIYANGSFEAISLDTRETISYDYLTLESVPTKYSSNAKTIDYKMQQNMMSYIDTLGNVIVINLTTGKKYIHTPETKKVLKFVQLSESSYFSTVQVSDLASVVYEFDYITNEKALALSTLEYSYFTSPESNWKISQKWTDETSLEDRYISIEDNKVKVNLIATDTTTRIRFMVPDHNAEKEISKLTDYGDLGHYPFYYDYDMQTNRFYLTNIETGAERILPFKSDATISEIVEFIVHDDSLSIATKDMILFCTIRDDCIEESDRIALSNSHSVETYFSFSLDRKLFAYIENQTVIIYKYANNGWNIYDTIKTTDNSFVYNIKFGSDNSKLCIEYCDEKEKLSSLVFFEDTGKEFVQYRLEEFGKYQMQEISDDMSHSYAYKLVANGLVVIEADCDEQKRHDYMIETEALYFNEESSSAVNGSLISVFSKAKDLYMPLYVLFNNDKPITKKNAYSVSRPVQVSNEEIAYIERDKNKDSLVKYNVVNNQKTIIPLPEYGIDNPPYTYGLCFLKDGYISVAALYCEVENNMIKECLCMNYLFEDLELDKLLLKCESLYR